MSNIQALFDGWSANMQRERAASQMTLGAMIKALEAMPSDAQVANLGEAHSYRGYYSDISFEMDSGTRNAADLLNECRSAMGKAFTGYKGGEFVMGELTPVWVAPYGCCGEKLMSIREDGSIETAEDE